MDVFPSFPEFLRLAGDYNVVPVRTELLADRETAVGVFEKLVGTEPGFLLESVEGGEAWARWSFIGWNPAFTLTSHGGRCSIEGDGPPLPSGDPLAVLEQLVGSYRVPHLDGVPPLHSGIVGYLGYDAVRYVERLSHMPPDDRNLPEMMWQFVGSLAALDRFSQTLTLIENVFVGADPAAQYEAAVTRLERSVASLGDPALYPIRPRPHFDTTSPGTLNMSREVFEGKVRAAIDYIRAGDVYQVVPSLRIEVPFEGDPFAVYRALRLLNPSPYLFFIRHREVALVGSSPELMTRARDSKVYSRPIAGTRRRGLGAEEDHILEEELRADEKERAEHVMLVDLARNDLGRVCSFGSITVDELMVVERYSHVMHLVSAVSGELRSGVGPVDVLRATFPHGTVTGAPKVRAMEIIDTLEPQARGPYAGAVGYLDFSGNLDTAIALRTLVLARGRAWVQAGAGVVADSRPADEFEECRAKAAAALAALAAADRV